MKGPWERLGVRIDTLARYHRFEEIANYLYNPNGNLFRKLLGLAKVIQEHKGKPINWRIKEPNFTIMLGVRGSVTFYPQGWGPAIANAIYTFLTEKAHFKDSEFLEFVKNLELARVEVASQVGENAQNILEPGKLAIISFPGLSHIKAAKIEIFADSSYRVLELESGGPVNEVADVHRMITNPVEAAGYIRQTRDTQIELQNQVKAIEEKLDFILKVLRSPDFPFRSDINQLTKLPPSPSLAPSSAADLSASNSDTHKVGADPSRQNAIGEQSNGNAPTISTDKSKIKTEQTNLPDNTPHSDKTE